MKKLIPADTVDANGKVHETVGENIRNGEKNFSANDVKAIVDILFPVGSVYCGESAFILSVGKWEIASSLSRLLLNASSTITGSTVNSNYSVPAQETYGQAVAIRMWKRVS